MPPRFAKINNSIKTGKRTGAYGHAALLGQHATAFAVLWALHLPPGHQLGCPPHCQTFQSELFPYGSFMGGPLSLSAAAIMAVFKPTPRVLISTSAFSLSFRLFYDGRRVASIIAKHHNIDNIS